MKKISRAQKVKIVENAKTLILVGLFLSCVFFCYKIFQTYREQAIADSLWGGLNASNEASAFETITAENQKDIFERLTEPAFVLINGNEGRTVISNKEDSFNELSLLANNMICTAYGLASEEITESEKKEWETALRTNSVYLRYSAKRYTAYETEFYQIKASEFWKALSHYSEVLIVPSKDGQTTAFFRNGDSEKILKAKCVYDGTKNLLDIMDKNARQDARSYAFAAELNLDEEVTGKAVLDSMIFINTDKIKSKDIVVDVPKLYKAGLNFTKSTEFVTDLINIFGYNPNTIRQYLSQEDALVFVGENGNLSIYPDGKIEYKALGINEGVPLLAAGNSGTSAITLGLCDIIQKVMKVSGVDEKFAEFDIKFAKQPKDASGNKRTEFFFDYFADGKRVVFGEEPAIYMAVEGGRLVEIKMQVKNIKELDSETALGTVIEEVDKAFSENPGIKKIEESSIVYKYNKNGEKIHAAWKLSDER